MIWDFSHTGAYGFYGDQEIPVTGDGTSYLFGGNTLTAVGPDGQVQWHRSYPYGYHSNPILLADGGLLFFAQLEAEVRYTGTYRFVKLDAEGNQLWTYDLVDGIPESVWPDRSGGAFLYDYRKDLKHLSGTGQLDLQLLEDKAAFDVADAGDGSFYTSSWPYVLQAFNMEGQELWHYEYEITANPPIDVSLDPHGNVYLLTGFTHNTPRKQYLYSFAPDGTKRYEIEIDAENGICQWYDVSSDNRIYLATKDSGVLRAYASNNGYPLWELDTGMQSLGSSAIDPRNGDLIAASSWDYVKYMHEADAIRAVRVTKNGDVLWKSRGDYVLSCSDVGTTAVMFDGELAAISPNGNIKWTCPQGGPLEKLVVTRDGKSVAAHRDQLVAHASDGHLLWTHTFQRTGSEYDFKIRDICVTIQGSIVVTIRDTNTGGLYAFDSSGQLLWSRTGAAEEPYMDPLPSNAGGILLYIGTDLVRIDEEGSEKWRTTPGGMFKTPLAEGLDGSIYGGNFNAAFRLDEDGNEMWRLDPLGENVVDVVDGAPVVARDGSSYFSTRNGLYKLSAGGEMVRKYNYEDYEDLRAVALLANGTLLVSGLRTVVLDEFPGGSGGDVVLPPETEEYPVLISFDADGSFGWMLDLDVQSATAAVDRSGNAYLTAGHSSLLCVSATGEVLWDYNLAPYTYHSYREMSGPVLSQDGRLLVAYTEHLMVLGD